MDTDEALRVAFGQALRRLRHSRGYSQERLALDSGISRAHMSGLELGKYQPTLSTMMRISGVLGIPTTRLMREIEKDYKALLKKR